MFETQMTIVFTHRPYTVPGKCDVVPDTACAIGSESSVASVLKNCNWEKWYYPHWKIWAKNIFLSLEYSGLNIISSQISLAAGTVATMAPVALIVWPTRIARRDRWGYGHGHVGKNIVYHFPNKNYKNMLRVSLTKKMLTKRLTRVAIPNPDLHP